MSRNPDAVPDPADPQARRLGRYELLERIASGGMATVYLGRALGSGGFERVVAVKVCHDHLRQNEDFVKMFLDEARLAAKIHHPNVVATIDVSDVDGLYLVMDFIEGDHLLGVIRAAIHQGMAVPPPIALRIVSDMLTGLHAAHELTDSAGSPYNIVHRDVSPPNILVGLDGITRIADFGVAKAAARATETRDGQLKGKIAYMAPEQFEGLATRQADVFSAGVVLWETLVGKRLFAGKTDVETMRQVLMVDPAAPSTVNPAVPPALDAVVLRALAKNPEQRYASAADFADAIETTGVSIASSRGVTAYLTHLLGPEIETRRGQFRRFLAADVVPGTPAPGSGITSKRSAGSDAHGQQHTPVSSPGLSSAMPGKAPITQTAPVPKPSIEAKSSRPLPSSAPRPSPPRTSLKAPTLPPAPRPTVSTPPASQPAVVQSNAADATPASPVVVADASKLVEPPARQPVADAMPASQPVVAQPFEMPPVVAKPADPVIAPTAAPSIAPAVVSVAVPSTASDADEAIELPMNGTRRRGLILGAGATVMIVGLGLLLRAVGGSNHPVATVHTEATVTPIVAPTPTVVAPPPVIAVQPEPMNVAPPSPAVAVVAPSSLPARPLEAHRELPVVAAHPTQPAVTSTHTPAATHAATPGGLRHGPSSRHGYVPDDI